MQRGILQYFVYHSERSCWHKMYRLFLLDQIPWIQIEIGHNVDISKYSHGSQKVEKEEKNGHESLTKVFRF